MTAEESIAKTSTELKKRMKGSTSLQKLLRRINSGKATFADTAAYSDQVALMVGDVLSDCVRDPQTAKFSGRVAEALLKEQYEEINSVMQTVQAALDKQRGLHIAPQKAALPLDRIKAAAYSLVDVKATAEQLVRRAESAPVTVVRSYHDQYIHENAMFRSSAGLRCFLVRTTDGKCCKWCSAKAGRYEYGEHPEDIFRRHDNCGCTVTYENGRQRQNVWSKEKWEVPEAGTGAPKPTILNYAQGKELQAKNMQYRGLTSPAQSGIMEENNRKPITQITNSAIERVPVKPIAGYTEEQWLEIQRQHRELLEYSRANNEHKEIAFVFDRDLKNRREFVGKDDRLDFGNGIYGSNLFIMHNHPRNGSYSATDIAFMISHSEVSALSIVKNCGDVETLTKLKNFDAEKLKTDFGRILRTTVKTESEQEYAKAVKKLLEKHSKEGGMLEWKR